MAKTTKKQNKWEDIDYLDVISVNPEHQIVLGTEIITGPEVKNLQEEVRTLKNFHIWKIMQETIKQKAIEKGVLESTEWEHTLSAKMMLHNLGILKSILEVVQTYVPPAVAPVPKRAPKITKPF